MAYTGLAFVSHHLLRPEPSVAALADGDAALNGLGLACLPDHALRPDTVIVVLVRQNHLGTVRGAADPIPKQAFECVQRGGFFPKARRV
ncbi:hypothetical protein [Mesorhizobium escarrei]|uniref:hypothetical protein n=1 Tax=Mesorhizobium escarrei TaxID=666018 RepID=UPI0020A74B70|nr:hypothetical protein [Mesorhizobium escarrei]